MLTGEPANGGESPADILARRADIPTTIARLVSDCVARSAERRPESASVVLRILNDVGSDQSTDRRSEASSAVRTVKHVVVVYTLVFIATVGFAWIATIGLGLPSWVIPGTALVTVLGLPVILLTSVAPHFAAQPAEEAARASYLGRAKRKLATLVVRSALHLSWHRAIAGGVLAIGGFALFTAGFMTLRALGIGPVGSLLAKRVLAQGERLLVTDFHIVGADSAIGPALGVAARAALTQSTAVKVVPAEDIAGALERMRRPRNSRVDLTLGRQIAIREGIRSVVDGHVVRTGSRFDVGLRLVTADSGRDLIVVRAAAGNLEDILPTLDRLARQFRGRIGESLKRVRASPPLPQVTTHSIEALRLYAQGNTEPDFHKAISLFTRAVQADTEFAEGWRKLNVVYSNLGIASPARDSAFMRAYRYRLKLPEIERLRIEGRYHSRAGPRPDRPKAIAILEQQLALGDSDNALINLAEALWRRREFARAESLDRINVRRMPNGIIPYVNLMQRQVEQGKFADVEATLALALSRRPDVWRIHNYRLKLLYLGGNLDAYERALDSVRALPGLISRRESTIQLRDLSLLRGRLRDWEHLRAEAGALDDAAGAAPAPVGDALAMAAVDLRIRKDTARAVRHLLHTTQQHPPQRRQLLVVGAFFADAGHADLARQFLARHKAAADTASLRIDEPWTHRLLASLRLAEGRFAEAVDEVRKGDVYPDGPVDACHICYYLALGTAFDRGGQSDSAIVMLERYVNMPFSFRLEVDALHLAAALRRLGELHEPRGERLGVPFSRSMREF